MAALSPILKRQLKLGMEWVQAKAQKLGTENWTRTYQASAKPSHLFKNGSMIKIGSAHKAGQSLLLGGTRSPRIKCKEIAQAGVIPGIFLALFFNSLMKHLGPLGYSAP